MEPFLAEIRPFAGNFAPKGWALCNGQLLPIAQYSAVFSLLGTMYGGNGQTNFALPNLMGQVAIGMGDGPGLTPRIEGEALGASTVTLSAEELPLHSHSLMGSQEVSSGGDPGGNVPAGTSTALTPYDPPGGGVTTMSAASIAPAGGGLPHDNMQPYLGLTFIIALEGIFPSRS